jgi:hypothetical protein
MAAGPLFGVGGGFAIWTAGLLGALAALGLSRSAFRANRTRNERQEPVAQS